MKTNYSKLADQIIERVGGKENIISVTNCMTRLRFALKDDAICNDEAITALEGVSGVGRNTDQYQIIIGMDVPNVRKVIEEKLNLSTEENKEKMNFLKLIGKIMNGVIPYMIASGIITGVAFLYMMAAMIFGWDLNYYTYFNAVGNAMFYFFPFILGYNVMKALDVDPILGILLAGILCHPTINGVDLTFFGMTFNVTYTSTFLPIIFTCLIAKPIYNFFSERLPIAIRSFTSVMLTMIIAGSLGFFIIGPVMNYLSNLVYEVVMFFYNISPTICGIIIGGTYEILVMLGLHGIFGLVTMDNIINGRPDVLAGLQAFALYACMFTVLAMYIKTKNKSQKSNYLGMFISSIFGVTEPVIYGALVPNMKLLIPVCIGGAVGGAVSGFFGIKLFTYSGLGVIGLLGLINPENPMGLLYMLIGLVATCVTSFVITMVMYKDKKKNNEVYSPINGKVLPLEELKDDAFKLEIIGSTLNIDPTSNIVKAPFDGVVKTVFPTKHSIGLVSDDGKEILIHVGIDTVRLEGQYFESFVKENDRIKKGDSLIKFDKEQIENAGFDSNVLVICSNSSNYKSIMKTTKVEVSDKDVIMSMED